MIEYFSEDGKVKAATVIAALPVTVTQVKTLEKDGYTAIQVGALPTKESRISKPKLGHLKGLEAFKHLSEVRIPEGETHERGKKMDVSVFEKGDTISVSGITKAKGFQGVVKRHGFAGGPRSHGQKHSEREPGSIGGGLRTRVPKAMRMAGRMGGEIVTVSNLKILEVIAEENLIVISGAVPGRRGTVLEITGK